MAALTFDYPPLSELVKPDVRDRLRPKMLPKHGPVPGYTDRELRDIISAARADVTLIKERVFGNNGGALNSDKNSRGKSQSTGQLTSAQSDGGDANTDEQISSSRPFVTRSELVPMLVLLVAATGWNVETIKELPSKYRKINDIAVELSLIKRRRGAGKWHQTVTWEIGPPNKQLSSPGGLYLLFHEIMSEARSLLEGEPFWAISSSYSSPQFRNPFGVAISGHLKNGPWTRKHGLTEDSSENQHPAPLRLTFNRLKTSIDVRRTRHLGGHLPSAARSNTTGVLFRNYLSGDPSTIDWAHGVMTDTLIDVENAAWQAHQRNLNSHGRTHLDIRTEDSTTLGPAATQTPWTTCSDYQHHPVTGKECTVSFLDCFHCANCVITGDHLPQLLSLLDALETRRSQMSDDSWWRKYGATWAAIRHEVMPSFSEAEINNANLDKPDDSHIDLAEPSWEHP
ncbi:hypothetical protein [Corynebacterium glyciniphilum]|uniref:hypothetical protein n=1 Tax=Corynebacterium glyciniphilum TaxID=1404244 RepID=UPI0011AB4BBD|nr:hypothetical protein [Corynebacterium glyciniphilum]